MRRIRRLLLPPLAAALLVLGLNGPAAAETTAERAPGAGPSATVRSVPGLSDGTTADSAPAAERIAEYWTPERMAKAVPADEPAADLPGTAEPAPAGRPADTSGPAGSTPPAPPAVERGDDAAVLLDETPAVGKVFFTNPVDGRDYVCSGSALNSPSKQMVLTAGHCVNTGGNGSTAGQWMENWTYVPRYRDGSAPFGSFAAKEYRSFNGWVNDSSFAWDAAMVTTWPSGGDKLVDATGGHGLSWNYDRAQAVTVWGYPVDRDSGQVQWWCSGTTERVGILDGRIQIKCDFGGGSSGGPWLREYSDSSGLGYANGVMSTVNDAGWNRSPYFDDNIKAMFDAQGSRT
ncbi:hypothetical protein CUT44_29280 [Streptomyces carminius]|uniref:Serine protease n=1 Tax=Streptomyces carminius TaxID=2665496 RepID=A0A2M8LQV6_9ACTN|nr:hypothetical protein [Streptomyces carminius]PJE94343.1 hypothetical protein CUT44_29280 [Streptomyces carminius]